MDEVGTSAIDGLGWWCLFWYIHSHNKLHRCFDIIMYRVGLVP